MEESETSTDGEAREMATEMARDGRGRRGREEKKRRREDEEIRRRGEKMRSADSLCPIRIIFLFLLQLRAYSLTRSLSLHRSLSATPHCLSYRLPR